MRLETIFKFLVVVLLFGLEVSCVSFNPGYLWLWKGLRFGNCSKRHGSKMTLIQGIPRHSYGKKGYRGFGGFGGKGGNHNYQSIVLNPDIRKDENRIRLLKAPGQHFYTYSPPVSKQSLFQAK